MTLRNHPKRKPKHVVDKSWCNALKAWKSTLMGFLILGASGWYLHITETPETVGVVIAGAATAAAFKLITGDDFKETKKEDCD